jgi:hypothetical protein
MGILVIVANKVFERFQVSPDHYETELAGGCLREMPRAAPELSRPFSSSAGSQFGGKTHQTPFLCQALLQPEISA